MSLYLDVENAKLLPHSGYLFYVPSYNVAAADARDTHRAVSKSVNKPFRGDQGGFPVGDRAL